MPLRLKLKDIILSGELSFGKYQEKKDLPAQVYCAAKGQHCQGIVIRDEEGILTQGPYLLVRRWIEVVSDSAVDSWYWDGKPFTPTTEDFPCEPVGGRWYSVATVAEFTDTQEGRHDKHLSNVKTIQRKEAGMGKNGKLQPNEESLKIVDGGLERWLSG